MAAVASHILRPFVVLAFLAVAATSRPCKTLFISTYSFYGRGTALNVEPNPNFPSDGFPSAEFVTIVTEFTNERLSMSDPVDGAEILLVDSRVEPRAMDHRSALPVVFPSSGVDSFRARARDILSVVASLLFGVGCGALTASTMYIAWYLFSSSDEFQCDVDGEADYDDEDLYSPKKMGYVKIPAAEAIPEPVKVAS